MLRPRRNPAPTMAASGEAPMAGRQPRDWRELRSHLDRSVEATRRRLGFRRNSIDDKYPDGPQKQILSSFHNSVVFSLATRQTDVAVSHLHYD